MPLQEGKTGVGQMEMPRLYLPDGFFNRGSGVRTASDFGLAVNVRRRVEQGLDGVLLCRHTQVTAGSTGHSGSAEPICLQIGGRSPGAGAEPRLDLTRRSAQPDEFRAKLAKAL